MDKFLSLILVAISVICVLGQDNLPGDVAGQIDPEVSW
jgi:hypothetical protein